MTLAAGIDEVTVNFTPGSLTLLSILLAFIMFGIALDTTPRDFRVVARHPRPFVLAIAAQLLILPAITFVLTLILPVTPSMALGMLLVACCPPGNISQILTHRAGGNVALSVSMTAVSNVIYIVALPLSISFWGSIHPDAGDLLTDVRLDPMRMLVEIALIIGVPFALGLGLRSAYPRFADRVQPTVKWVGLLALVGFSWPPWPETGRPSSLTSASSWWSSPSTTPRHWGSGGRPWPSVASAFVSARR